MNKLNYEEDVRIDETALDVEWLEQAQLMRKYTEIAADAKKEMNNAKEYVDYVKATIDRDIRVKPEAFGVEKITETVVSNTIILQDKYQKAVTDYNDARYEYDIASGVVQAFEQRKTALENLVKLMGQSYFAGPQTPRDLSREYIERAERKHHNAKVTIGKKGRASTPPPAEVDEEIPAPATGLRRKKG